MRIQSPLALAGALLLAACAQVGPSVGPANAPASAPANAPAPGATSAANDAPAVGVLVMAHGGDEAWNASVMEAVAPLSDVMPTEVAFGMANPMTLKSGIEALDNAGVDRVAVVRMFLSGESFYEQTEYFLGMSPKPPEEFVLMGPAREMLGPNPLPVAHDLEVATHTDGIMQSVEAAQIIGARARDLATSPESQSVLILAHGMGDDGKNQRVIDAMGNAAAETKLHGFAEVRAATLREDWEDARVVAEREILAFVREQSELGRDVLVVPYRLSGFGPYASVLEGLDYTPASGLLPHPRLTDWVTRMATRVICDNGWHDKEVSCDSRTIVTDVSER